MVIDVVSLELSLFQVPQCHIARLLGSMYIRAVHLNKIFSDEALLLVGSSRHTSMTFLLKKLFSGGLITLAPGPGRKEGREAIFAMYQ